jgi:hypothetical protein
LATLQIVPPPPFCSRTFPNPDTTISGFPSPSKSATAGYPSVCPFDQIALPSTRYSALPTTTSCFPSPSMSAANDALENPAAPTPNIPFPRSLPAASRISRPTITSGDPSPSMSAIAGVE